MSVISETGLSLSPYPGLRPFRRDEADIFFGREEQVDQLLGKLETCRFLAVVGVSGCGKSSLVRAGMLSALESGFMASAGSRWQVVEMRPGGHPLANLARTLLRGGLLGENWRERDDAEAFACAVLRRGPLGLVELMRESLQPRNEIGERKAESGQRSEVGDSDSQPSTTHHSPLTNVNLLLLVDQFEEIFRFHQHGDPGEATAFVDLLLESARQEEVPIYVVLTMRSDFVGDCSIFADLPEAINDGQFLIPRLTREQCRAAVVGPAAAFGASVQPELVNHILNDIGSNPDQLPLMQHALMRVWNGAVAGVESGELRVESQNAEVGGRRSEVGEEYDSPLTTHHSLPSVTLTLADYESVGGLKDALSNHADELFASLSEDDERIAETLFRSLSERGADGRDIRRPVPLQAVADVAQVPPETIERIVNVFREPACSFLTPPAGLFRGEKGALRPDTVLDITHESLIRQWHRMAGWVQAEAESAAIYRRLSETAVLWKEGRAALWVTPDLENALAWRDRERPNAVWAQRYGGSFTESMAFLDASVEAHDRRERQEKERQQRERELLQNMAHAEKQRADDAEERRKEQATANVLLKRRAIMAAGAGAIAILLAVAAFILYAQAKDEQVRADQAREDAEIAKRRADQLAAREAEARKQSQKYESAALQSSNSAFRSLGQAHLAQLRSLWNSNEPGRQIKALQLLRESAKLRETAMRFATKQGDGSRQTTLRFWTWLTPQLREQAVRWLSLTSLQPIRGIPFSLSGSRSIGLIRQMKFALSGDGRRLAVFKPEERNAGELQILDVGTGNVLTAVKTPSDMRQFTGGLGFSEDGRTLLVAVGGTAAPEVQFRSTADLSIKKSVPLSQDGWSRTSSYSYGDRDEHWFDAAGKHCVYSGHYGVAVWDANTGRRLYTADHTERAAKATRIDDRIAVIRRRRSLALVSLKDGKTRRSIPITDGNSTITGATLSPDGKWLAVELNYRYTSGGQYALPLLIVDTGTGETVSRVNLTQSTYTYSSSRSLEVAFHPRRPVLSVLDGESVALISVPQGGVLYRARPADAPDAGRRRFAAEQIEFNGTGDLLMTALRDAKYYSSSSGNRPLVLLQLWDPSVASASLQTLALEGVVQDFRFTGEEALAIAGGDTNRTGVQVRPLQGGQPWSTTSAVPSGGFEPGGRYYVHVLPDRVDVLNAETGKRLKSIDRRWPGNSSALPVSSGYRWIAGVDRSGKTPQLRLFDVGRLQWTTKLLDPQWELNSIVFDDGGNYVAVSGSGTAARRASTRRLASVVYRTRDGGRVFDSKRSYNEWKIVKSGCLLTRNYEDNDYVLRAYDLKTGRKTSEYRTPSSGYTVSLSYRFWMDPDERTAALLVRSGSDSRVVVWPFADGKPVAPLSTVFHEYYNMKVQVLRDRVMVSGRLPTSSKEKASSTRYAAQLWDLKTRKSLKSLSERRPITFLGSAAYDKLLLFRDSPSSNSKTQLWDARSAKKQAEITGYPRGISDDGRFAVFSRGEVLDLSDNKLRPSPNGLLITSYVFSKDSRYLVTLRRDDDDSTIGILDLRDPNSRWMLDSSVKGVSQTVISPDSRYFMAYSYNSPHLVHLRDLKTGKKLGTKGIRRGNSRPDVDSISPLPLFRFSPHSRHYAVVSHDQLRLGNTNAKQVHTELPRSGHRRPVHAVAVSPDRRFIASGSADQTVCFWRVKDGRFLGMLEDGGKSSIRHVTFSPRGNLIAYRKENGEIVVWKWFLPADQDAAVTATYLWSNARGDGGALAFNPDGTLLATGDADGGIRLFDARSGKLAQWLQPRGSTGGVSGLAFSPDGRRLAASRGHVIGLWDMKSGSLQRAWDARQGPLFNVAFPADGRFLVSTGRDVRVWDPKTAALQLTLDKQSTAVRHVAVSDSGERLAFAVDDRSIVVTNVTELLKSVEQLGLKMSPDASVTGTAWKKPLWTPAAAKDVAAENALGEFLPKAFQAERNRDWKKAVAYLTKLIEVEPENAAYRKRRYAANLELKQWKAAAEDGSQLLDAMPKSEFRTFPRSVWLRELLRKTPQAFAALEAVRPQDPLLPIVRGRDFVLQGKWREAKTAYGKLVRSAEPHETWYEYAALCVIAGDRKGFREHLAWMATRKEEPKGHFNNYVFARAAAMGNSGLPPATYLNWAETSIKEQQTAWYLHAVGLAYYRAGNDAKARQALQESMKTRWMPSLNQLAMGLVEYRSGNYEAAKALLKKVRGWRDKMEAAKKGGFVNVLVPDWVEVRALLPELEALVAKGPPPERPPVKALKPKRK